MRSGCGELSVSGSTLGCVTAIDQPAPSRTGGRGARRQGSGPLSSSHPPRSRSRCRRPAACAARSLARAAAGGCDAAPGRRRGGRHAGDRLPRHPGRCRCGADHRGGRRGGIALISGALLPAAPGTRRAAVDLLVRVPEGGYVPVVVVRHRITDPGEGAVTSSLALPWPGAAAVDGARRVRSHPRDMLRLAHLHRLLRAAGWAPAPAAAKGGWGGVIGFDADAIVWHDLRAGHWPGGRSTFTEYDARVADRMAVATAAVSGRPRWRSRRGSPSVATACGGPPARGRSPVRRT